MRFDAIVVAYTPSGEAQITFNRAFIRKHFFDVVVVAVISKSNHVHFSASPSSSRSILSAFICVDQSIGISRCTALANTCALH